MEGDLGVSEDALEVTSDLDYLPANDVDHRDQHEVPRDEDAGARFEGALGVREFDLDETETVEREVESLLRAGKFELVNWRLVGVLLKLRPLDHYDSSVVTLQTKVEVLSACKLSVPPGHHPMRSGVISLPTL